MSLVSANELLSGFDSVKSEGEKLLWGGRPKFVPYILRNLISGLFLAVFGIAWLTFSLNEKTDDGTSPGLFVGLFGLVPLLQGLYSLLKNILCFPKALYRFSETRVLMRNGVGGTDFKSINYEKISNIEVGVNVVERKYSVGTINFFSGHTQVDEEGVVTKIHDSWYAIENPHEVFRMVQHASNDSKRLAALK